VLQGIEIGDTAPTTVAGVVVEVGEVLAGAVRGAEGGAEVAEEEVVGVGVAGAEGEAEAAEVGEEVEVVVAGAAEAEAEPNTLTLTGAELWIAAAARTTAAVVLKTTEFGACTNPGGRRRSLVGCVHCTRYPTGRYRTGTVPYCTTIQTQDARLF
jgi:hypothetical protein